MRKLRNQERKVSHSAAELGHWGRLRASVFNASPAVKQGLNKGPAESTKGSSAHSEHRNYSALLPSKYRLEACQEHSRAEGTNDLHKEVG